MNRFLGLPTILLLALGTASGGDRRALIIENGPSSNGLSIEQVETSLHHAGFSIRREQASDTKEMESLFSGFANDSVTNGIGVIVFRGPVVEVIAKEDGKSFPVAALLTSGGDPDDQKSFSRHSFTFAKIRDRMVKSLGTRKLIFFLDTESIHPIREQDLLDGTSVRRFRSIADLQTQLPKLDEIVWLESDTVRPGEFAGQQWVNDLGMVFCWCPPGKFVMGDARFPDAKPVEVEISEGFWISKYETTQRDWYQLRKRDPKGTQHLHPLAPIAFVKHHEITGLFRKYSETLLKEKRLPTNWVYTLPTEAEWEYAARAGNLSQDEASLDEISNCADATLLVEMPTAHWANPSLDDGVGERPATVSRYRPNNWGIHDMLGNVAEWVEDHYYPELAGGVDPTTAGRKEETKDRVFRGGSWVSPPEYCDPAFRNFTSVTGNSQSANFLGFRLLLKPSKP